MYKETKTEVLVLGAGPAGYSAAFRCADLGLHTTIINEYSNIGGVCLNVGCIPSKTLLHITNIIDEIRLFKKQGTINFKDFTCEIQKIKEWKNSIISKLSNSLNEMLKLRKIKTLYGIGKFLDKNTLLLESNKKKTKIIFKNAIIASGSRNINLPFISKNKKIWDSTDALKLDFIPKNMLVVGGGIIGLEISTIYQSLGSNIDIVESLDQIIFQADKDIINNFMKCINNKFNLLLNTKIIKIEYQNSDVKVTLYNKNNYLEKNYDVILVAIGRKPNSDLSNINNLGITTDKKGFIIVNKQMQTNIENIYAVGDITGQPMLAHKGTHQGHIAAEVIYGKNHYFEPKVIPSIVYTNPEIAWVGLTEKEAKEKNIDFEVSVFPWSASGRAISSNYHGMTKLIFDKKSNIIIGGAVVGKHGGELIGEIALAIEMGCCAEDMALTIHAHPTLYESIGLAASIYTGSITDLPNKKIKNNV